LPERAFVLEALGLTGRLERRRPPEQVINHHLGERFKLREPLIDVAALKVSPQGGDRDMDGRANEWRIWSRRPAA
jgi:hypothetical protein